MARPYGASEPARCPQLAPAPTRTRVPVTSTPLSLARSMTIPPSLVDRPLMPWPRDRIASGTGCRLANASASATSAAVPGRSTSPGAPERTYVERTFGYAWSPGSTAVSSSAGGSAS